MSSEELHKYICENEEKSHFCDSEESCICHDQGTYYGECHWCEPNCKCWILDEFKNKIQMEMIEELKSMGYSRIARKIIRKLKINN